MLKQREERIASYRMTVLKRVLASLRTIVNLLYKEMGRKQSFLAELLESDRKQLKTVLNAKLTFVFEDE